MSSDLGYRIARDWGSGFTAVITMPGGGKTGWSLQFAFPQARIMRVEGAQWRPSAAVTAARRTGVRHAGQVIGGQRPRDRRRSPARRIPTR